MVEGDRKFIPIYPEGGGAAESEGLRAPSGAGTRGLKINPTGSLGRISKLSGHRVSQGTAAGEGAASG